MALTGDLVKASVLTAIGSAAGSASDYSNVSDCTLRKAFVYFYNDNNTAGTTGVETLLWTNNTGVDWKVTRVDVITINAVTANDTNYGQLNVAVRRVATPATQTTIAAPTTQTTGQAAGLGTTVAFKSITAPNPGSYTVANNVIQPGDVLTAFLTKPGTGVAMCPAPGTTTATSGQVTVMIEPVL